MITVSNAFNKQDWDSWMTAHDAASFLQSWEWGEFQTAVGHDAQRVVLERDGQQWCVQALVHRLAPGLSFLYVPRAIAPPDAAFFDAWLAYCEKNSAASFVRLEPQESFPAANRAMYPTRHRQSADTIILSLDQPDDALLAQMHKKTRYNIRLADRKGVVVTRGADVEAFWRLNQETRDRDDFRTHPKSYYETMLACPLVEQYTASYEGEAIAAILVIQYGDTAVYVHGASSNRHRNVMAPYVLQWQAIQDAKVAGCRHYDFWGVAGKPADQGGAETFHTHQWDARHTLHGVSRFKAGFGGERRAYPDASEIPLKRWRYRTFRFVKRCI